jgi:hypothetical protein
LESRRSANAFPLLFVTLAPLGCFIVVSSPRRPRCTPGPVVFLSRQQTRSISRSGVLTPFLDFFWKACSTGGLVSVYFARGKTASLPYAA